MTFTCKECGWILENQYNYPDQCPNCGGHMIEGRPGKK